MPIFISTCTIIIKTSEKEHSESISTPHCGQIIFVLATLSMNLYIVSDYLLPSIEIVESDSIHTKQHITNYIVGTSTSRIYLGIYVGIPEWNRKMF